MTRANVTTAWAGAGTDASPYHPRAADDYPLLAWTDLTNAPGGQGAGYQIQADMADATYSALLADPSYGPGKVQLILKL